MASTPAVVDGKAQEHCKRRQRARLRRLVVDENAQQHRPYNFLKKPQYIDIELLAHANSISLLPVQAGSQEN